MNTKARVTAKLAGRVTAAPEAVVTAGVAGDGAVGLGAVLWGSGVCVQPARQRARIEQRVVFMGLSLSRCDV